MKGNTLIICIMLISCNLLLGQQISLDQLDKKTTKTYKSALKCLNMGERAKGKEKLAEVVNKYPNFSKATKKLVGLYLDDKENEQAIALMKIMEAQSEVPDFLIASSLSYAYEDQADYDMAIATMADLLKNGQLSAEKYEKAQRRYDELVFRQSAYAHPSTFVPVSIGTAINTADTEYHPRLTADGSEIVYVKVGKGAQRNEDLYTATKLGQDSFSIGTPLTTLNSSAQEGAFTLSPDGKILIFTACGWRNSIGGCDLYISFKKKDGWSEARNMGPTINSRFFDSAPSLSADNRTLYFSSKRPGGQGGADIWKAELNKDNTWDTPINLGATINTAKNDEAPFIHPDGKTLYFISEGHIGLGSYDVFYAKRDDKGWAKPVNLGYPINTKEREGGLFVDLLGNRAYYSSQIDFSGQETAETAGDIYYFDLPVAYRPELVSYLKLDVRDEETGGLINATVELKAGDGGTLDQSYRVSGVLLTTIVPGNYGLSVNKEGYLFHSENIVLEEGKGVNDPFIYSVSLQKIEKDVTSVIEEAKPVILNNIFFNSGSAELLPSSDYEISKLALLLQENSSLRIKILGHTDNVGTTAANLKLSSERAKAVYDRLIASNIDRARLEYEGRGESEPITDNDTEEGRQTNRRTEFVILN